MTLPVSCDPECFAAPVRLFTSLLNWLEQWCWWSTCCTWGVLKAGGEQVASGLVVPTHHCKRQKFGVTGLLWWSSPGRTMLRTVQSPYRMQTIFTERTEAFCMQLLPGLRSFTSTSICSKRRDLYLSEIWREFVWMERWSRQNPPCSSCSLLKSKDSCTLLTQTSTGKIWPINLTSTSGLAYTSVSPYEMQIRSSSSSQ